MKNKKIICKIEEQNNLTERDVMLIEKVLAEKDKDILTARRCLNFKLIKCNNKDCKNLSCPLNRRYDE